MVSSGAGLPAPAPGPAPFFPLALPVPGGLPSSGAAPPGSVGRGPVCSVPSPCVPPLTPWAGRLLAAPADRRSELSARLATWTMAGMDVPPSSSAAAAPRTTCRRR